MNLYDQYHPEILRKLQAALAEDTPARYPDLKKYIGTELDFIGLSVPVQRKVFKTGYSFSGLSHQQSISIWNDIWLKSPWYEVMTQALYYIGTILPHTPAETVWEDTRHWVGRVDNWAHSDGLSDIYAHLLERAPDLVFPQLQAWNTSSNPWERRQSVVGLLEYSKKRVKVLPVSRLLAQVKPLLQDTHYFVQKGVGWTLREIGNVYPEKTLRFLEENLALIRPAAFTAAIEKLAPADKDQIKLWRKKALQTKRTLKTAEHQKVAKVKASPKDAPPSNSKKTPINPAMPSKTKNHTSPSTGPSKRARTVPPAPSKGQKSRATKANGI